MSRFPGLERPHEPDWQALVDTILRKGTPKRVHHIELFHDGEIRDAIAERFGLLEGLRSDDPHFHQKRLIAVNRFCGFDHVSTGLMGMDFPMKGTSTTDTANLPRQGGRTYMEEHAGPITTWEEFEKYPWPDPLKPEAASEIEWYQENLPEDMCLVCHTGHFAEFITWLMGYETLCYALYDQRDLVEALARRILQYHEIELKRCLEYDRVKMIWGSDDMGFKTGIMISAKDMRDLVLTGHQRLSTLSHEAGRPYLLHSCGNLTDIIEDLIEDVKIDAKHSFEDTIEDVRQVKRTYGGRIALLGGIDVDFLCRADEKTIRQRVRETLEVCLPGGGYCLGTGNSVTNYIPLDHYLAMVDEGRLYGSCP